MSKLFSIILCFLGIFLLTYSTFAIKSNYDKKNEFETIFSENSFEIDQNGKIIFGKGGETKVKNLNESDKILYIGESFEEKNQNGNINIKFGKGIYLVNINSLDKKYIFENDLYNIEAKGINTFFIDNTAERVKIISIDSIIKLDFLVNNNIVNNIYLYPNQYIFFDPLKNNSIANVDISRMNQILSFGFFKGKILNGEKVNNNFKRLFFPKDELKSKNVENLFSYIYFNNKEKKEEINKFLKEDFPLISGENLMIDYEFLVLNKSKKSKFLKKEILKSLQNMIKEDKADNTLNLDEKIEELKNSDTRDYEETINFIKSLNGNLNSIRQNKIDLNILLGKLIDKNYKVISSKNFINFKYSFFKYNFSENKDLYTDINNFIENKDKNTDKKENIFFIFFLNNIILSNLEDENVSFENTIDIFSGFSKLAIEYYLSEENDDENSKNKTLEEKKELREKTIETGIVNFNSIITKLLNKMEKHYFKVNQNGLFEQKGKPLDKNYVNLLEGTINDIYQDFYTKNEYILKNTIIKNNYLRNFKKFEKIKLALVDYEKYLVNNDQKIFDITNREIETPENEITVENAKRYLSRFRNIRFSERNIEVMGAKYCNNPENKNFEKSKENISCYKITDIEVGNGNIVSFLLHPNDYNKITNIIIGGDKNLNRGTYRLDNLEENYKNNTGGGFSDENDNKNKKEKKFENFFVDVLIPSRNSYEKKDVFEEDVKVNTESSIIRTLKNTSLLGRNGTLTKLKPILDIKYDDVAVTESKDKKSYIIKINNSTFRYKDYEGTFYSDYKYKGGNLNYFFNPEINLDLNRGEELAIRISGLIDTSKFENYTEKIFPKIAKLKQVLEFSSEKEKGKISIVYTPGNDKLQLSTKNIRITISGNTITDFTVFGKKLLEKNENLDKIDTLLNNL